MDGWMDRGRERGRDGWMDALVFPTVRLCLFRPYCGAIIKPKILFKIKGSCNASNEATKMLRFSPYKGYSPRSMACVHVYVCVRVGMYVCVCVCVCVCVFNVAYSKHLVHKISD